MAVPEDPVRCLLRPLQSPFSPVERVYRSTEEKQMNLVRTGTTARRRVSKTEQWKEAPLPFRAADGAGAGATVRAAVTRPREGGQSSAD